MVLVSVQRPCQTRPSCAVAHAKRQTLFFHARHSTQMQMLHHIQNFNFFMKVNASLLQSTASVRWLGLNRCSHRCTVAKSTSSRFPLKSMPLLPLSYQAELLPLPAVYPSSPVEICASTTKSCQPAKARFQEVLAC